MLLWPEGFCKFFFKNKCYPKYLDHPWSQILSKIDFLCKNRFRLQNAFYYCILVHLREHFLLRETIGGELAKENTPETQICLPWKYKFFSLRG